MEQNQINEGNELIASFMGAIKPKEGDISWYMKYRFPDYMHNCKLDDMRYHHDWQWLMPVLEKICRMRIGDGKTYVEYACPKTFGMLDKKSGGIMVRLEGYHVILADTLLEATYLAVIDFIIHYNGDNSKSS